MRGMSSVKVIIGFKSIHISYEQKTYVILKVKYKYCCYKIKDL